ncbi:MAG: putative 2-dehydropantoate 2-reductase [Dehalococcoidia bacterium]
MATIGIIGAGAVGSFYGALLARAGHDVRFLFRSDLDTVRERGLDIRSKSRDFRLERVAAFGSAADIGTCDWVICALKATAMDDAHDLVAPCLGPDTRIVALMNGLGIEERFAEWFGATRVFGGMAFVCLNRVAPGVVRHIDYGRVTVGHALDDPAAVESLSELLAGAGIEVVAAPSLRYARWEKLCWNVPFNGLSVAAGGVGTATILGDEPLRATAEQAMREVVAAGNADLEAHGCDARFDAGDVIDRMFAQTATMGDYRTSMVIDYVLGRALEVEAILGEPVRRAAGLGVRTPVMQALYALVRAADGRRRGLLRPLSSADVLEVETPSPGPFAPGGGPA